MSTQYVENSKDAPIAQKVIKSVGAYQFQALEFYDGQKIIMIPNDWRIVITPFGQYLERKAEVKKP